MNHFFDAPIPDAATPVQQEHAMHPYHDMYMQEFQSLHAENRLLHRDYSDLYESACEINTEMVELTEEFYAFKESQQTHNQHMDTLMNDNHLVLRLVGQPTRPSYYPAYPHPLPQQPPQNQQQYPP
ncbi:unnamed protein product [Lactuca virosa]|uniref:Uncharacterized protein n=1 Tax=Lactuca virosa TaxID=75947 RepID=A0AAU9NKN8_9ASTR|nr:unnamed protein product [Lactuca virosa]